MSAVAVVFAIAKAVPAAAQILEQAADMYAAYKREQNQADENAKNDRNAAAIAGAAAAGAALAGQLPICAGCPLRTDAREGRGQHQAADGAPAVPYVRSGRT
jgi:hypothetical protein